MPEGTKRSLRPTRESGRQRPHQEGALILHPYSDDEGGQKSKYQAQYCTRNKEPYVYIQLLDEGNELPNNEGLLDEGNELPNNNEGLLDEGNELPNNEGGQKPKHRAQYKKGKRNFIKKI